MLEYDVLPCTSNTMYDGSTSYDEYDVLFTLLEKPMT